MKKKELDIGLKDVTDEVKTSSLSILSPECEACPFVKKCKCKRMVAEAYLMPESAEMSSPVLELLVIKHDYRDIKVAPNTTITIDLEELKKQIERDIYRKAGIGLNYGA